MASSADIAYQTFGIGKLPAAVQAIMQAIVLPKSVLDNLGLRVTSDNTTNVNPVTRTIRLAFGPSGMTDATATVQNDGSIKAIVMGNRGDDYIRPPLVTLSPKVLTPALLRAFLRVKDFTIVGGAGYATPPTVTFIGGLPPAGRTFRGCVRRIFIKDGGLGYPNTTTISIVGGSPSSDSPAIQAKASITVDAFGRITSVTLTDMGAGYTQVPKIQFNTGGVEPKRAAKIFVAMAEGTPAQATATVMGNAVTAITLSNPGGGYVAVPDVILTGGGGAGASVTARMEIERVDTLFGGAGYPATTTVAFTPYFKTLFPDSSDQKKPFIKLFQPQFVIDAVSPMFSLAPVLM